MFINQIMDDVYTYEFVNKLFISSGETDHDTTEDLQRFLRNQTKKMLKITASGWIY